jgi:hypothetical protein
MATLSTGIATRNSVHTFEPKRIAELIVSHCNFPSSYAMAKCWETKCYRLTRNHYFDAVLYVASELVSKQGAIRKPLIEQDNGPETTAGSILVLI